MNFYWYFGENAHVRAMCVRPKIKCENVRACEAKNRRNSQLAKYIPFVSHMYAKNAYCGAETYFDS